MINFKQFLTEKKSKAKTLSKAKKKNKEEDNEGDEGFNIDTPNRPANTRLPPRSTFSNPPYEPGDNGMSMTPKPYGPTESLVTSSKVKLFNELTNMAVGNHMPVNRKVMVVYPDHFEPFHKGHHNTLQHLKEKFPQAKVYFSTSERSPKFDPKKEFLNFDEKLKTAVASGIDPNDIVKTASPYHVPELVNRFPKDGTVLIIATSKEDKENNPVFKHDSKKNRSEGYFKDFKSEEDSETLDKHAYCYVAPIEKISVLGKPLNDSSELIEMYKNADDKTRKLIITELYGKFLPQIYDLFNEKLG